MSEHRPHWDDSLVEAVRREIYGFLPVVVGDQIEVTCAVIAAVEDWARWEHVPKGTLARIERVREQLHKPWKYECECCTRIWIALEGDSDD